MRVLLRIGRALLLTVAIVLGASLLAGAATQTPWFKQWLRGVIVREVNQRLNATLSIDRISGNLFSGIDLDNVVVSMNGHPVISIDAVHASYNVPEIVSKGIIVRTVSAVHPRVVMRRDADGWELGHLAKKSDDGDRGGHPRPILIPQLTIVDGTLSIERVDSEGESSAPVVVPKQLQQMQAALSLSYKPDNFTFDIVRLVFRGVEPEIAVNEASGVVAFRHDALHFEKLVLRSEQSALTVDGTVQEYRRAPVFALQVTASPLALPEIGRLIPAVKKINLQPSIAVGLHGPIEHLGTDVNIQSAAGDVVGQGVVGLGNGARGFAGHLSVRHLDLAQVFVDPKEASDIVADLSVDVKATEIASADTWRGTVSVDAPLVKARGYLIERLKARAQVAGRDLDVDASAHAFGADTTAAGSVRLPVGETGSTAFDLRGRVRGLELARLPASLHVPPAATNLAFGYRVNAEVPRQGRFRIGGDVAFDASTVSGTTVADGGTGTFGYGPAGLDYQANVTVSNVDLQRIGDEFHVHALANGKYHSAINGHVNATVHGFDLDTMDLNATGAVTDSSIFGARFPQMSFETTLDHDALRVRANGELVRLNPAVPLERPSLDAEVTGTIDADVTFDHVSRGVDVDSIEADVTADLGPSRVGQVDVDRVSITGDYHNAVVDVQSLEVAGSDITASGNGTLALNDTGASGFWIHADAANLDRVAARLKQPVAGFGTVDAIVTGNAQEFRAAGTLTGNNLKYGDDGALTATAEFTASVPHFDWEHANVTATSRATFVEVAGVQVNEVSAKTQYADRRLAFDATAAQPQRTLGAAGSLVLRPEENEVRFERLTLATQGQTWQTPAGHTPVITFHQPTIGVRDFQLTNGDQAISAEGVFGRNGEELAVTVHDVDMRLIDALLVRPPELAGRLNATGKVTGTKEAPVVAAEFKVEQGKLRNVAYDSLGGTAQYSPDGLTVDTRLQQNATQWLTAKGHVPLAAFGRQGRAGDQFDLKVESSPIDLGLVQGLTTALNNVKGSLQANVSVAGTSESPTLAGAVTVAGGVFTVVSTGVTYTGLDGRVDLQPDRLHIDQMRLVDNQKKPLTVTGDLSVRGLQVNDLDLAFKAHDFKVLDNESGNLRIDTDLHLAGTIGKPRLEGNLHVTTGSINLDPLLARLGTSAYATTAADISETVGNDDSTSKVVGWDALQASLHITIPDDLVVKASDLKTSGDPIGLGAVNLTLGGDLNLAKTPGRPITLVGGVNTVRGFYDFQGRRFSILRDGTIRFEGEGVTRLDPALNISAERTIQAVTARVTVRGNLRRPNIELSSTPPLEPSDILALIVFNQPINQLGAGQQVSLAERAGAMAAGALTGQLTNSIASSLSLDQFEINISPDSGSAAELVVGQQLGQNLYVRVQQGVGERSQTNVILEYEFAKWLRLQTNVLEGTTTQQQLFQRVQSTGVDLVFSFSFK